jgi:hydroxymethylbilane synthase
MTRSQPPLVKIGTRGSPLALAQAHETRDLLVAAHAHLAIAGAVEICVIKTSGDRIQDRTLAEAGGKGLFTKEIEEALADGSIDLAVHSMKDVPTQLPDGLEIACVLPREDVRDAWFSRTGAALQDLPAGAVVGTAGLRRQAQILMHRPDLRVEPLRGNVDTRIAKLTAGVCDATLLALAGLNRLNKAAQATSVLAVDVMLPAVAQGAVGIEIRTGDDRTRALLAPLHCALSGARIAAERAFLAVLDGSCRTPIAALATVTDAVMVLNGLVSRPDGRDVVRVQLQGAVTDAVALGHAAGQDVRSRLPAGFHPAGLVSTG